MLADILRRDERDHTRDLAAEAGDDAHMLDNSDLDIEAGVRAAIAIVEAVRARKLSAEQYSVLRPVAIERQFLLGHHDGFLDRPRLGIGPFGRRTLR